MLSDICTKALVCNGWTTDNWLNTNSYVPEKVLYDLNPATTLLFHHDVVSLLRCLWFPSLGASSTYLYWTLLNWYNSLQKTISPCYLFFLIPLCQWHLTSSSITSIYKKLPLLSDSHLSEWIVPWGPNNPCVCLFWLLYYIFKSHALHHSQLLPPPTEDKKEIIRTSATDLWAWVMIMYNMM